MSLLAVIAGLGSLGVDNDEIAYAESHNGIRGADMADALPGVAFRGKVDQVSPASGSQFALLPPDNATGNFTKIIQRVPVKILLDRGQAELNHLRPGLSLIATLEAGSASR